MKLKYSVNDDILVITLKDEPLSYGEEISGNIIAHYSDKDELVEIEILDANKFLRIKEEIIIPEKTTV